MEKQKSAKHSHNFSRSKFPFISLNCVLLDVVFVDTYIFVHKSDVSFNDRLDLLVKLCTSSNLLFVGHTDFQEGIHKITFN